MLDRSKSLKLMLGAGSALSVLAAASGALAEDRTFNLPASDAVSAIPAFAQQAGLQIIAPADQLKGVSTPAIKGRLDSRVALNRLISQTGLHVASDDGRTVTLAADPQGGSAGGGAETNVVQELVVTAQRKEEAIQTVPIAISAFTQKSLEEQKIEGGFDLLKAIPNVTFSKNNFSGYNFSIRGIGTKAISVTTDPGVAVEFNSTALIRNRLFEQEYFDVERVEVLRGPQGTLHGRNATAGVINVISAKPTDRYEAQIKAEVGNYNTRRLSGMINVPVIGDKLDVRLAGAWTKRDGYDFNATTDHAVNGRDLYSTRLTIGFKPTEQLHGDFVWEHFGEDDDRSRTGKQLCYHDSGPAVLSDPQFGTLDITDNPTARGVLSQGCKPGSLYDPAAFGTPNGLSIPFIQVAADQSGGLIGRDQAGELVSPVKRFADPYGGMMQSPDLRVINSIRDPKYRAKTDVLELNFDYDLSPTLTLSSQTAYVRDQIYSFQDYNRFNTVPIFSDTSQLSQSITNLALEFAKQYAPGGVFCDPQIGCSNSLAGFDISQARSTQFSQEFRVQSSFSGPVNFSAGVNYTRYKTLEDYYVLINLITYVAEMPNFFFNGSPDPTKCSPRTGLDQSSPTIISDTPVPIGSPNTAGCIYVDPNPVDKINGDGHNYFRSENPYRLSSWATFGEAYWQATQDLKFTLGLRYTSDSKVFTPVPSQVLLSTQPIFGGTVDRGYPALPDIKQHWGEVTGRFGADWRPTLSFTDQSLLYAFYSRGYKAGGANPPGIGYSTDTLVLGGITYPGAFLVGVSYPKLFKPEFVNAFEIGSKNTLMGGALTLNGDLFFYDYKNYQVSQIKERTAVNENFDSTVWGAEMEAVFQPARNTRFNGTFGFQDTAIADGEKSLDLMDRLQGHTDYVLVRPFASLASSCVVPKSAVIQNGAFPLLCGGAFFVPRNYLGAPNDGQGFLADLSGNELPNAPHWTMSFGGQQSVDISHNWRATFRADAYWQSQSWARVYNAVNDKLHGWYNVNLSLWVENPELGIKVEIYAKNLLNQTPITDAFLNSDDSALTTNVFVLDPRLIGFSVTKKF